MMSLYVMSLYVMSLLLTLGTHHSDGYSSCFLCMCVCVIKVHLRSFDPQKNRCNYLITRSIKKKLYHVDPRYSAVLLIYISAIGSKNKKLAVQP